MTRARPIPDTITVHVAFRFVTRGGRKEIVPPPGASVLRPRVDTTMVKALARAYRWKKIMESGQFVTATELAEREGITPSYLARVVRLTLLAPHTVEAILDGRQGAELQLDDLLSRFPCEWGPQSEHFENLGF